MHVACKFIGGSAHCTIPTYQIPASTVQYCSRFSSPLLGGVITQSSPLRPQHTTLDNFESKFFNCLAAFFFVSSLLRLAFPHFLSACSLLRNQLVAGSSQTPRLPCSTCSPQVVSHFLGDTALNSEYSQNLQASLQSIQHAMEHTQITSSEANAKSYTTVNTHRHTHTAASAARIPNVRSSTTERSKWYIKCSHATTNLTHYRLAFILMITGGSSPNPAHWYPSCNPPKVVTLVRMVPMSPNASQCPWPPQADYRICHTGPLLRIPLDQTERGGHPEDCLCDEVWSLRVLSHAFWTL